MTSGQRHRRLPADLINQHKRTGGAALSAALEVVSGGRLSLTAARTSSRGCSPSRWSRRLLDEQRGDRREGEEHDGNSGKTGSRPSCSRAGSAHRGCRLGLGVLRGTGPAPGARQDLGAATLLRICGRARWHHHAAARRWVLTCRAAGVHDFTRGRADEWRGLAGRKLARLDQQVAKAQTARKAISARCAVETRTSFNAPTSPASRPHVSPANRSTKATREAEGRRRRAAASAYKPRLCDREDTNFTPNPRSNPRRHDWPARGPGRIR